MSDLSHALVPAQESKWSFGRLTSACHSEGLFWARKRHRGLSEAGSFKALPGSPRWGVNVWQGRVWKEDIEENTLPQASRQL